MRFPLWQFCHAAICVSVLKIQVILRLALLRSRSVIAAFAQSVSNGGNGRRKEWFPTFQQCKSCGRWVRDSTSISNSKGHEANNQTNRRVARVFHSRAPSSRDQN